MDALGLLDLLSLESQLCDSAIERAGRAATTTERLSHLAVATEHALSCVEHVALLRTADVDAVDDHDELEEFVFEHAQRLADRWRARVLELGREHETIVAGRLAELR